MQKRFGELAVENGVVPEANVQSALVEERCLQAVRQEKQSADAGTSIRVPAERLDVLVNLVGELVTVQARLSQTATGSTDAELAAIAEEVERLTGALRDSALNIRMLPIGSKFKRLVRDLSGELGKEIEMTTDGAETELDKTVIERLNDPLVHLIRNSIDHGVELPEVRLVAGNPRHGTATAKSDRSTALFRIFQETLTNIFRHAKATKVLVTLSLAFDSLIASVTDNGIGISENVLFDPKSLGIIGIRERVRVFDGSVTFSRQPAGGTRVEVHLPLDKTAQEIKSLKWHS